MTSESIEPTRRRLNTIAASLAFALVLAAIGIAFRDTLAAMVAVWNTESFAHGWVVPPIAAWLAWTKRDALRRCRVAPFLPALAGLLACGGAWLIARLAGVNAVEQFALVGMIPWLVALVYGWSIAWTIAMPLLFLFFAVPFGQFLQPPLMEMTADFTVAAVQLSGVPIIRDGLHFELPTGRWSVVEACSGLRYLLAALPLAFVYAYLSYRSIVTRALFIGTVVVVAIVANWLRAYIIVMLGHVSGMKLAVGVDHLIYGWVFFGVVMGLSFWVGSFWQDSDSSPSRDPANSANARIATSTKSATAFGIAAAAALGLAATAAWPLAAQALRTLGEPTIALSSIATATHPSEQRSDRSVYHPMYDGGVDRIFGRSKADDAVGVQVVQYVRQNVHGEMITWGNRVVPAGPEDLTWQIRRKRSVDPGSLGAAFPGAPVNEYEVSGPSGRYLVWEWFWVNGRVLTDPRLIKLYTAFDLIRGRGDESVAWFLWTPMDTAPEPARERLARAANGLRDAARLARVQ